MEPAALREGYLFEDLDETQLARLAEIARLRTLRAGERLIILGDTADRLYVVVKGKIDLCFPLSLGGTVKDVCVESMSPGAALGWSALVKPYRFTLSARAAETCEVAAFLRKDLQEVFESDSRTGYVFMNRIAELIGDRLLKIQALWVRELQRAVTQMLDSQVENDQPAASNE